MLKFNMFLYVLACILVFSCSNDQHSMVLVEGSGSVKSFYISKYEITQAEFERVMGFNPSRFKSPKRPVEYLTIWNTMRFLNKLSILENKVPAYLLDTKAATITLIQNASGYRLPSIEEWTYAKQGGKHSTSFFYAGSNELDLVAWYGSNSDNHPQDIGTKLPNELGLYDMTGNVWEFCFDPETAHPGDSPRPGFVNLPAFPIKGGGWSGSVAEMDPSITTYIPDADIHSMLGFRLVLNAPE